MIKNYDNYFLPVEDFAAAKKFYAETLGLPVKFEFADMGRGVSFCSEPFRIRTGWAVEFTDPAGNLLGFTDYRNP